MYFLLNHQWPRLSSPHFSWKLVDQIKPKINENFITLDSLNSIKFHSTLRDFCGKYFFRNVHAIGLKKTISNSINCLRAILRESAYVSLFCIVHNASMILLLRNLILLTDNLLYAFFYVAHDDVITCKDGSLFLFIIIILEYEQRMISNLSLIINHVGWVLYLFLESI